MKKCLPRVLLAIFLIVSCCLAYADYLNIPSALGFKSDNINWDISSEIWTNIVVVVLYFITYETLNKRSAEKEINKKTISKYLIKKSYEQCLWYLNTLSDDMVKKYIIPKMNFDGGANENSVVTNLKNAPFENEDAIRNLVNDGQVPLQSIQGYFRVKQLFSQYITTRTTLFDAPHLFNPIAVELRKAIKEETGNIDHSR